MKKSGRLLPDRKYGEARHPVRRCCVTDLLDGFNLFLYNGQGRQIREKRNRLGITQREYAPLLGIPLGTLKKWEQNKRRIFKSTWERYFK